MLNEWQEFLDYTEPVEYRASGKKDTAWLGRFTFEALRDFSGMNRILTILARGFLFHAPDGTLLPGRSEGADRFCLRRPVRLVQYSRALRRIP